MKIQIQKKFKANCKITMTNTRVWHSRSHTQVDQQSIELFMEGDKNKAKSKHKNK